MKCAISFLILSTALVCSCYANSTISLSSATYNVNEGDPLPPTFTIVRSGDLSGTVSVNVTTVDRTATAGVDYYPFSYTAEFPPGVSEFPLSVFLVNDHIYEGTETFDIVLTRVRGADARISSPSYATVNIADSLQPPYLLVDNGFVKEPAPGQTTTALVTFHLSYPTTQIVTASYSMSDGTATAGLDYVPQKGTITFAPLEWNKTVPVTIIGDTDNTEGRETFFTKLSSAGTYTTSTTTIVDHLPYTPYVDMDGNCVADYATVDSTNFEWFAETTGPPVAIFGVPTDKITPADFTGDGRTDIAVWRPSDGTWYVLRSEDNSFFAVRFGIEGDIPMPADYDRDGTADLAVFRPSTGVWYIQNSMNGQVTVTQFGSTGDLPVAADYDGDWMADIAIFRPNGPNGAEWWMRQSSDGAVRAAIFGKSGDRAVPADYDGDGEADISVWRPSNATWYIMYNSSSVESFRMNSGSMIPAPGDYTCDGKSEAAAYLNDSNTRLWEVRYSAITRRFGGTAVSGDIPVANAFVR